MARLLNLDKQYVQCAGPCRGWLYSWSKGLIKSVFCDRCRDGKARPTEPGTFPLAHGATARVGRLRAYGNAICAPQAAEFVGAYMNITSTTGAAK